jgi:hypothetical protein
MANYRVYAATPQNIEDLKQRLSSHCEHTDRGVRSVGI